MYIICQPRPWCLGGGCPPQAGGEDPHYWVDLRVVHNTAPLFQEQQRQTQEGWELNLVTYYKINPGGQSNWTKNINACNIMSE